MKVAVVIPLFNGARWIEQTLASVLAQDLPASEVMVVDDGSTDGSAELAGRHPNVRVLRNPGKGPNAARNHGLAQTAAPLVAFLDHDDLWHPAHLRHLAGVLERYPACPAAFSSVRPFRDGDRCSLRPLRWSAFALDPWRVYPQSVKVGTPSAALLRRGALAEAGGWDARFTGASDYHLWLRLAARSPLVKSRAVTVGYRTQPDSLSFTLRTRKLLDLMGVRSRAAADALRPRLAAHPEQEGPLHRRLRLAELSGRLVEAHLGADRPALRKAARDLERVLRGEPRPFLRDVFVDLLWLLCPPGRFAERARQANALMTRWHKQWPRDARRTRGALFRLLFLTSLARLAGGWWGP
jgi:hypothetical protein